MCEGLRQQGRTLRCGVTQCRIPCTRQTRLATRLATRRPCARRSQHTRSDGNFTVTVRVPPQRAGGALVPQHSQVGGDGVEARTMLGGRRAQAHAAFRRGSAAAAAAARRRCCRCRCRCLLLPQRRRLLKPSVHPAPPGLEVCRTPRASSPPATPRRLYRRRQACLGCPRSSALACAWFRAAREARSWDARARRTPPARCTHAAYTTTTRVRGGVSARRRSARRARTLRARAYLLRRCARAPS